MATFILCGNYSSEGLKEISADRTTQARDLIKNHGGEIKSIYSLLGEYDLIFIVDLPNVRKAMEASLDLSKLTGVSFRTSPAIEVEVFDEFATEG